MSRGQENQVVNTSSDQNKQFNENAQQAYTGAETALSTEQGDIGQYQDQLAKFAASNPYTAGGAYQTAQNKVLANTADAAAQRAGQTLQSQATRTGQNAGGAIAATEAMQQQNTRDLSADQSKANAERIGAGADYGSKVLSASSVPASLEGALAAEQGKLTGTEADAGNAALGIDQKASEQPSFLDTLGSSFAQSFGSGIGSLASGKIKPPCWVAAELYGGWENERTITVRAWLFGTFRKSWYGRALTDLYVRFGERAAERIRTRPVERRILKWLFDKALQSAREVR